MAKQIIGDYIEMSIGVTLGIGTMTAAVRAYIYIYTHIFIHHTPPAFTPQPNPTKYNPNPKQALGNILADVVGLNLGGLIEDFSHRWGIPEPVLSAPQQAMGVTRAVSVGGDGARACVCVGAGGVFCHQHPNDNDGGFPLVYITFSCPTPHPTLLIHTHPPPQTNSTPAARWALRWAASWG